MGVVEMGMDFNRRVNTFVQWQEMRLACSNIRSKLLVRSFSAAGPNELLIFLPIH